MLKFLARKGFSKKKLENKNKQNNINNNIQKLNEEYIDQNLCPIEFLPDEMLLRIFCFLLIRDIGFVSQVCHRWSNIAEDDYLWFSLYKYAKKNKFIEVSTYDPWAPSNIGRSWKKAYRKKFHVDKSKYFFKGNKDAVHIVLDSTTFYCTSGSHYSYADDHEPSNVFSGVAFVNITSEFVTVHGLYIVLQVVQKTGKRGWDDRFKIFNLPLMRLRKSIGMGAADWNTRKKQKMSLKQGRYRVPFAMPMPTHDTIGNTLPPSLFRAGQEFLFEIKYFANGVLARPWPHSDIKSPKTCFNMHQYSQKQLQAIVAEENMLVAERRRAMRENRLPTVIPAWEETLVKEFMLGKGRLSFALRLDRRKFCIGDKVCIGMRVDATRSVHKGVKAAKIKIIERLEGVGCTALMHRGHAECRMIVNPGEARSVRLVYELRRSDIQGPSLTVSGIIKQCYYLSIELVVPFAINPKMTIPIILLESLKYPHHYNN